MRLNPPLVALLALLAPVLATGGCASTVSRTPLVAPDPPLAEGVGVEPGEPLAAEPAAPLPEEAPPPATPSA